MMILAQMLRDVSIGAGGITALGVVSLLVKKGVTGSFSIGGGKGSDKYDKGLCEQRHHQLDAEIQSLKEGQTNFSNKTDQGFKIVDEGFKTVHNKLDRLIFHLLGDKQG